MKIYTRFMLTFLIVILYNLLLFGQVTPLHSSKEKGQHFEEKGDMFWEIEELDSADFYYQKAENQYLKSKSWKNFIALVAKVSDDDIEAILIAKDTIERYLKTETFDFAYLYHKIGVAYYCNKDFENAKVFYTKALKIRLEYSEKLEADELGSNYYNLGNTHLEWGRVSGNHFEQKNLYKQAIEYFEQAIEERNKNRSLSYKKRILTYQQLANVYYKLNNFKKEMSLRKKAVYILDTTLLNNKNLIKIDTALFAETLTYIGETYHQLGDYRPAIAYGNKVLGICRQPDFFYERLGAMEELAITYSDFQPQSALVIYRILVPEYISLYEESKDPEYLKHLADAFNNTGLIFQGLQVQDSAIFYFNKSLEINQKLESRAEYIWGNYENLANSYRELANFDKALEFLKLTEEDAKKEQATMFLAGTYDNLGDVFQAKGDFNIALENYQSALNILVPTLNNSSITANPNWTKDLSIGEPKDLMVVLTSKAKTLTQRGQPKDWLLALEAIKSADTLVIRTQQIFESVGSKYLLLESTKSLYETAIMTAIQLWRTTKDSKYLEEAYHFSAKNKAFILMENLQDEAAKLAELPTEMLKKEEGFKKKHNRIQSQLIDLKSRDGGEDSLRLYQDSLFTWQRDYQRFVEQLEHDFPKYHELKYTFKSIPNIESIQKKIPKDAAVLEYFIGTERIYTFVISRNEFLFYGQAKPSNFKETCLKFKAAQRQETLFAKEVYAPLAEQLFEWLLGSPLEDLDPKINRLFLIPDDVLLELSFDSFFSKKQKNWKEKIESWKGNSLPYLLYDYAISYAYSIELLFDKNAGKRKAELIPYGGFGLDFKGFSPPVFDELIIQTDSIGERRRAGLDRLYHTINEIEALAKLYEGDSYINAVATKQIFEAVANQYQILHIATHAIIDEAVPLNSALIFYATQNQHNFSLRVLDLYRLNLNADLVFLSGCNTATEVSKQTEGVRSISRAFAYAGCPSIVASLWSIPDNPAIPVAFHQYLKEGLPKDKALQQAKIAYLKSSPIGQSPADWSPLVLVGDTSPLSVYSSSIIWMIFGLLGLCMIFSVFFYRKKKQAMKGNYFVD